MTPTAAVTLIVCFILFGLWSLFCVYYGARLGHAQSHGYEPPAPVSNPIPESPAPDPEPLVEPRDEAERWQV